MSVVHFHKTYGPTVKSLKDWYIGIEKRCCRRMVSMSLKAGVHVQSGFSLSCTNRFVGIHFQLLASSFYRSSEEKKNQEAVIAIIVKEKPI